MSEKAEKIDDFTSLEYSTQGGPELGLGVHEVETRLHVDLATRVAFLNRHQPTSTEGGEPIGTFQATLAPDLVSRLREALAHANLGKIPPGTGGGPGTSLIQIRAKRGDLNYAASFSSRDMETLDKLDKLLALLDDTVAFVAGRPFQAIRIELQAATGHPVVFTIKVKNVGTETVAIPDLALLGRESKDVRDHGIGVRVAANPPERPGYTAPPLVWSRVEVASTPPTQGKPILLPPGGEQTLHTVGWAAKGPAGPFLAQAFFSYYAGPPIVDEHLVMRGHALSTGLDLVLK
jgi:hypothetical protein